MRPCLQALTILLIATGCAGRTTVVTRQPAPSRTAGNTTVTLNVPPGHLPPAGECRVWIPGTPPGRQPRPRSCTGIAATAPAGSWILYRPSSERRLVHVRYVDDRRPGTVIRVRVFEAESGKFVRDERP
jgi:hypothetical protein